MPKKLNTTIELQQKCSFPKGTLRLISYRGNLYGQIPNDSENNIQNILKAIDMGLYVMVDMWKVNQTIWFGNLHPEHQISQSLLSHYKEKLYVACSTRQSLQYCCNNRIRSFAQDTNAMLSLVSNGEIWVSPENFCIEDDKNYTDIVLVQPEMISSEFFWNIYLKNNLCEHLTICTSYPLLLKFAMKFGAPKCHEIKNSTALEEHENSTALEEHENTTALEEHENSTALEEHEKHTRTLMMTEKDIWDQGLLLDSIYDTIYNRPNPTWSSDKLPTSFKQLSSMYSISAFSDLCPSKELLDLAATAQTYFSENDVVYTCRENRIAAQGCLHFTHIQLVSFEKCELLRKNHDLDKMQPDEILSILRSFRESMIPNLHVEKCNVFSITEAKHDTDEPWIFFHRVLKVPCGLVLVGYPNFPIGAWREEIHSYCDTNRINIFSGPSDHKQDIVHATLVRFLQEHSSEHVETSLQLIQAQLPILVKLKPREVQLCNYTMDETVPREYSDLEKCM